LFGIAEIAMLCKSFEIDNSEAAEIVLQFALFKRSSSDKQMGNKLRSFVDMLKVLPVSSADCERGFIQMNLYHTSGRNRLLLSTVNDMMMIGINGPPLHSWNVQKYVLSWLKSVRHSAFDKQTGKLHTKEVVAHRSKLFA
jgi:hypothetical protein